MPLIGNVFKSLAKSTLIPDAAIHKKMFGSGNTTSIISNKEMNDIMKVIKSLEESGLLIKGISETIKNEAKDQKGGILGMLLGTLAPTILAIIFLGFLMFYKIFLSPQVK